MSHSTLINNPLDSAIVRGIKHVGVGKKGSQDLSSDLVEEILQDYQLKKIPQASWGAFLGGLLIKGVSFSEQRIESCLRLGSLRSAQQLIEDIAAQAPGDIKQLAIALIEGKELSKIEAYRLGQFLFSTLPGDSLRGLVASILRVRYETPDEYEGLLLSINETISPAFLESIPLGRPVIQLAEPFDGVDHSYILTPLIAQYLQTLQFRVLSLVGRNSGPKFVYNLRDLALKLNANFLKKNADLNSTPVVFGYYADQVDVSIPMDHWVNLRRQTVKRPFLATLEKFVNPWCANILITSAFHPPYTEKMLTIAERAGFGAVIVVRNGLEGGIPFALKRPVRLSCSVKNRQGTYSRQEIIFEAEVFLNQTIEVEEKLDLPNLDENVRLIQQYQRTGSSGYPLFDYRVKATCEGLRRALEWIDSSQTC